jgi:glycosyltransferase involved in cell wall biosynthesis
LVNEMAQTSGCLGVNLKILSAVPKKEMSWVLAAADISISTVIPVAELEANSANKVFDGMAAGCCIAINHGGWLASLLNETKAGMVLPQDIPAAARELTRWLDNPELLSGARAQARALAEQRFSRDTLAVELNGLLIQVVKN